jgi:hypothetical protein
MFKFNSNKLLATLIYSFASLSIANADTLTLNTKSCTSGVSYETMRSTKKILFKKNRYVSSANIYTEKGTIGSYSYKEINLDDYKGMGKIQNIFVKYKDNFDKNITAQLLVDQDKLCITNNAKQQRCYYVDYESLVNSSCAEIQLCTLSK